MGGPRLKLETLILWHAWLTDVRWLYADSPEMTRWVYTV